MSGRKERPCSAIHSLLPPGADEETEATEELGSETSSASFTLECLFLENAESTDSPKNCFLWIFLYKEYQS